MSTHRARPVWLPLLVVVLMGGAMAAAGGCGVVSARAEARDEWRRSYPVSKGMTFELKNTNGRIRIETSAGNTIEVVAIRTVKAPTEAQAKATLADFTIEEKVGPSRIELESESGSFTFMLNRRKQIDYTVRAPVWVNLALDSTNGDIEINGAGGMLRAESTNGNITATALEGSADVETTNGNVRLEFARLAEGGIRSSTTNGDITVALPKDSRASFSAKVTNGTISTTDLSLATTEQSRRKLEGNLGGGGGPTVKLSTTNGGIHVRGVAPVVR